MNRTGAGVVGLGGLRVENRSGEYKPFSGKTKQTVHPQSLAD